MATLQVGDTPPVLSQSLKQFRDESKRKSGIATYVAGCNFLVFLSCCDVNDGV